MDQNESIYEYGVGCIMGFITSLNIIGISMPFWFASVTVTFIQPDMQHFNV